MLAPRMSLSILSELFIRTQKAGDGHGDEVGNEVYTHICLKKVELGEEEGGE